MPLPVWCRRVPAAVRSLSTLPRLIAVPMLIAVAVLALTGTPVRAEQAAPATAPEPATPAPSGAAALLSDRVLGDANAPVTILDFSSLTCPHCAAFHNETLPKLKERYIDAGKVKVIFRDFPLDRVALKAAMMARCAPAERYFPMLDVLFKQQARWGRAADPVKDLATIGRLAGIGQADFDACQANKDLETGLIERMVEGQKRFNISSTPTFIINDTDRVEGAYPFEHFAAIIDRLLAR